MKVQEWLAYQACLQQFRKKIGSNGPKHRVQGNWLKRDTIYWAANLDPAAGFRPNGVRNTGLLVATMTRPANLGLAIDTRTHTARWNSSDPNNQTHTPG